MIAIPQVAILAITSGTIVLAAIVMRQELGVSRVRAALCPPLFFAAASLALLALGAPLNVALVMAALTGVCVLTGEIDRRSLIIPDMLVVSVALLATIAPFGDTITERALGGLFLGAMFFAVYGGFRLAGREGALGLGDVKLAAAIGAFLGPYFGLVAVALAGGATIAALIGGVVLSRTQPAAALGAPFGIGLSAALCIVAAFRLWALP